MAGYARAVWFLADPVQPVSALDPSRGLEPHPAALQVEADARGDQDWDLHLVDGSVVRAHAHGPAGSVVRQRESRYWSNMRRVLAGVGVESHRGRLSELRRTVRSSHFWWAGMPRFGPETTASPRASVG